MKIFLCNFLIFISFLKNTLDWLDPIPPFLSDTKLSICLYHFRGLFCKNWKTFPFSSTVIRIANRDFILLITLKIWLQLSPKYHTHFNPHIPSVNPWQSWVSTLSSLFMADKSVTKVWVPKLLKLEPLLEKLCVIPQMKAI